MLKNGIGNRKNNITSPNNTQHNNNNDFDRYIILPNNPITDKINSNLKKIGIKTVTQSTKTVKNILQNKNNHKHTHSEAGVYTIDCLNCNKKYVGETSRSLGKRLSEQISY